MSERKTIPIFAEPEVEPIKLGGHECRVRRLRATEAPAVITAFLSDFGAVTAEYLATTVPEDLIELAIGMNARGDTPEVASDGPTEEEQEAEIQSKGMKMIKMMVASQAFQRLADRFKDGQVINLKYFTHALLIGKLEISGVLIETWDELDETRIAPVDLGLLLFHALEANFDPGFGGQSESDGKSDPPKKPVDPLESRPQPQTQTTKSEDAGSARTTGRSARRPKGSNN